MEAAQDCKQCLGCCRQQEGKIIAACNFGCTYAAANLPDQHSRDIELIMHPIRGMCGTGQVKMQAAVRQQTSKQIKAGCRVLRADQCRTFNSF